MSLFHNRNTKAMLTSFITADVFLHKVEKNFM